MKATVINNLKHNGTLYTKGEKFEGDADVVKGLIAKGVLQDPNSVEVDAADAEAQAADIVKKATEKAAQIVKDAEAEAQRITDEATAARPVEEPSSDGDGDEEPKGDGLDELGFQVLKDRATELGIDITDLKSKDALRSAIRLHATATTQD